MTILLFTVVNHVSNDYADSANPIRRLV